MFWYLSCNSSKTCWSWGRFCVVVGAQNIKNRWKGQCYEIFDIFLYKKNSTWAHMIRQNRFCEFCCFREDIREKLCLHSLWLRGHCVSVVNNYADMCQHSQQQRGHVSSKSLTIRKSLTSLTTLDTQYIPLEK